MSTEQSTHNVGEFMESLTGFDEIAMEKHLGVDVYTEGEAKPMRMMRALAFVVHRRAGLTDVQAKEAALSMPVAAVNAMFADNSEDVDPSDPDSESGKGDSEPDSTPKN